MSNTKPKTFSVGKRNLNRQISEMGCKYTALHFTGLSRREGREWRKGHSLNSFRIGFRIVWRSVGIKFNVINSPQGLFKD